MKGLLVAILALALFDVTVRHGAGIAGIWHMIELLGATIHRGVWAEP